MTPSKIWLIVAIVFLILEILPPPTHFALLCLAFGALAASIGAWFSPWVWLPWVLFVGVSGAMIPVLIPLAKFLFTPKPHASNVDALVHEKALVLEAVDPNTTGSVKIRGEIWRAKSEKDSFSKDQWVRVERVEGTHVYIGRQV